MKFKISYSVEIFECQYFVENQQIYDDGYCSLDESTNTKMHKKEEIKHCDDKVSVKNMHKKTFASDRIRERGRANLGESSTAARAASLPALSRLSKFQKYSHSPENKAREKFSSQVKMKTPYSAEKRNISTKTSS